MLLLNRPARCVAVAVPRTRPVRRTHVLATAKPPSGGSNGGGRRRRSSSASQGPSGAKGGAAKREEEQQPLASSGPAAGGSRGPVVAAGGGAGPAGTSSSSSSSSSSSRPGKGAAGKGSNSRPLDDPPTPIDALTEGIRAAADSADAAIQDASDLAQQGIGAAQAAAEDVVANTSAAAASLAGSVLGAVDGVAAAASDAARVASGDGSGAGGNGAGAGAAGSAVSTGSFDTVNVRVPGAAAWANNRPGRGPIRDATLTQDFDEEEVSGLKVDILAAVASLDRGLAANLREARGVDRLAAKLESAAGPVTLRWATSRSSPDASTMDRLGGTWRLIYSSGFNGGSLGGSRPGPPAAVVPSVLGQVYQVIDTQQGWLDNVVELLVPLPSVRLPFLPPPEPTPAPGLRATLRHTYEVAQPNKVTIVFESTLVQAIGPELLQGLPQLALPELPAALKPPAGLRSASFDVTYLDDSMRVTRGDRGELRIYLRDSDLIATAPEYVD